MRCKPIRTKNTRRLTLEALESRLALSVYYASLTGSDSNPGTLSQPFATINHGASVLTPGDTLYIRAGTYAEQLVDAIPGGTSWTAPVTISAYPGETVILEPSSGTNAVLQFQTRPVSYIEIDNLILDARNLNAAVVWIDGVAPAVPPNHIRLRGDELRNSQNPATAMGFIITGKKTAGSVQANYNEVINCKIHDINTSGSSTFNHGMYIESSYNLIEGNEIYNTSAEGIQFWATGGSNGTNSSYNIFRNNKVHDTGLNDLVNNTHNDAGVVVSIGDGNVLYNNLLWNNTVGFFLNTGDTNTKLYNNTVAGTYTAQGQPGIFVIGGTNTDVENNIVANSAYFADIDNLATATILKNNLVTQSILYGTATFAGNITGTNALFVNAAAHDFHLQAGSPAINAGLTLPQVPVDFDGLNRPQGPAYCIGAYEFPVSTVGATHLQVVAGSSTTAGTSFSLTVTALDANNNISSGYTGSVHFTSSDSAAILPSNYTFTAADAGVHTFSGIVLKTAGSQSVTATDTVTSSIGGSASVTVNPAAASILVVTGYPSPTTVGTSQSFTVTADDAYGNTATGYAGTLTFSSSDSQAVLPANYKFTSTDAGVHSFSATLKIAGSQSITATDTVTASITGTQSGITVNAAATSHLSISAPASATAGSSFSFTITALDANNSTVTGYLGTIQFTSSDSAAVLPTSYTFTATDAGVHTFTGVILKTTGSQSITATDTVTSTITGAASVTVNPAAASTLVVTGYTSPATAGTSHSFTVTADDAYGNTATGYVGTVNFTSSDGQAVLPANYKFTSTDAGVHSFSATLKTAGSQSITATDTVTSSIIGSQTGITVSPAAASKLVGGGYPSPTTAGVSHSFTVTAQDAFGNTATGYAGTLTISSSDGQAVLPANYKFTSTDAGVHSFSATLKIAGSQSITATDTVTSSIKGSQTGITVSPAAASKLVVGGYPSPTTAGVSHSFTVTAQDAFGNTTTGYAGTLTISSSDGQAVLPANYKFTSTDAGVHSFSATFKTAGSQSITATDTVTSSIIGSQTGITVSPAAASKLVVGGYPSPTTAGVSHSFTVTAQDAFGNTATGYAGTLTISSSDGQAVLPANYTFTGIDAGVHTFSATLKTAGSQSITATDTGTSSIKGSQTGISVNPAAASKLVVGGYPSPTTAGVSHSFTVTAQDAFGNTATGYAGTLTISSSDGQAVLPANYTFTSTDAGVHTFSATLKTAGSQSITATDTGTASITGTQSGITVNAAATSHLSISAPASATAGSSFSVTITAQDANNNTLTSYLGTIQFTSVDAAAILPSNYTFTAADAGVHTFTGVILKTAGSQSITANDTVTSTITGSASVTVNPAAASTLVVTGYSSPTTAGTSHSFTVIADDAYGNTATGYTGTLTFTSSDGQAVLPANYTFTGIDAGVHSFSATLKTAGSQSITATDTGTSSIKGSQTGISVNPAAASKLVGGGYPSPTTAGVSHSFTVTADDAYGNTATGYAGTLTFSSSDSQAVLPANYKFTSTDAGVHSFSATLKTAGSQLITATDTGTASITGTQSGITVNAAASSHLSISAPASATAGSSFSLTITALDANNNTFSGYTGTLQFTSSDSSAILPGNYTFTAADAGVHTFTGVILKTAGSQSITATDTVTSTITGSASVTVNPAAASTLVVTGYPSPTTAGTSHSFTVTADDAYGNTATGYVGTISFTSSDGQAILPAYYKFTSSDAGVHTFSATLKTAGSQSITATDTVTSSIIGSQTGITVSPAAASKLVGGGYPSPTTAGVSHSFTVTADDAYGNTATGYAGTLTFSSSDGQAVLPANYKFTSTDAGVHSFGATLKTAGSQLITATDTGTAYITGMQSGITVNGAAVSGLNITAPRSAKAGQAFTITVTAVDAFSNIAISYLGTVHFTSSDNQAVLPGNYTFKATDVGVHVFTNGVTLMTSGGQTVTTTDAANGSLTGQVLVKVNNGALKPGLYGRVSASGQLWAGVSNGSSAFTSALWATWNPNVTWVDVQTGDFNGDGQTDIIGRVAQSGEWWVGLSNGSSFTTTKWAQWSTAVTWVDVKVGDFNGDGKDDIAGRVLQTGEWWVGLSTGSSFTTTLWATWSAGVPGVEHPGVTWVDVQVGDFNGDGKADIAGRVLQSGEWWVATSTGSSFTSSLWATWSPAVTWVDVNVGDFNGDGKTDITGRVLQSGQWWTAISTGSSFSTSLWATWSPDVTWVDVKVGDFNGDGKADIIGRVLQSGEWWTGISTGSSFTSSLWTTWSPNVTWVDVQVGDFNGDGKADITGRVLQDGSWWTGLSNGSGFTTTQWGTWSPAVNWVDVRLANNC